MSRKRILSLSEQTGRGGQRRGRKAGRRRRNGASLGARACAAAVSVCLAAGMIQAALPLPVQAAQGALQAAVEETAAAVNENASGENSAGEDGSGQDTDSAKQREHASEIRPIVTQRPEKTVAVSIRTVSDLRELARNCSLDSYSLDKIVTLEEDLDLAGEEITIPSFSGTFDGQNHTISGVNLQGSTSGAGLFTYVEEGGVVENLRVEGTVTPDGEQAYAGGIAGTNRGLIRSCSFSGDVSAVSYVGGIAGSNGETGEIAGCTAEGTVQGTRYTGGIAGQNLGVIRRSVNEASVNTTVQDQSPSTEALESLLYRTLKADDSQAEVVASTDIGGIAGYSGGILQSCTNNGAVGYQHVGYNVGGIVGRQSGYLNGCVNNGAVYGRKDVGGIAGQMVPDIELLFSESSLADLQAELDTLNELLDTAAADAGESSAAVSERLGQTAEYLDGAQESAKEISDLLHGSIESNVATINSLAAAIDRHIDSLTPILSDFHTASSGATSLFDNMSDISGSLHESFRLTGDSISRLRSLVQNLKSACDNIRSSLDALKEALRLAGQNVPASVEQLEKDLAVLASQLNSLSQNIDKAQEEIKSGTVNTETARAIFNDLTGVLKQAGVVMKDLEQVLSDVNWSAAAGSDVSMPESGTSGAEKNETAGTDKTETSGADSSSDTGKTETSDNETSDTGKTETSGSGTSGEESTDTAGSGTTGSGNDAGASGGESTSGSETGSEESDGGKSEVSGMENSGADKSTEEEASGNGSEGNSSVNGGETSGTAASDSGDGGAAQREESSPVSHEDGSPESVAAKSTPVALLPEHSVTVASAAGYIPALLGSRDKENDRADSSENGNSGAGNSSASSSANGNSSANGGTDGGSAGDNSSTGGDSVNDNSSTDDTGDSGNDGTSPDSQDGSQNTDNTDDSGDSQNSSGGNSANGNSSTGNSSAGNSANGNSSTGNSSAGSSANGNSTGGDSTDSSDNTNNNTNNNTNSNHTNGGINNSETADALRRAMESLKSAGSSLQSASQDFVSFVDSLDTVKDVPDRVLTKVDALKNNAQTSFSSFNSVLGSLSNWANGVAAESPVSFTTSGEAYSESSNRLSSSLSGMVDELSGLNSEVGDSSQTLIADMQNIGSQIVRIMDLFTEALDEVQGAGDDPIYEDVSDESIAQATQGKVSESANYGRINGDLNVGGIAGSMGMENGLDPEDDLGTASGSAYRVTMQTKAILLDCSNYGTVTSKKNCAGGAAGRMDLGIIVGCGGYGAVSSTSGDYVGGICGYSLSSIRDSYAKCTLSGRSYTGGIVGSGYRVSSCASMVEIDEAQQLFGAVAGEITDTASGNIFVSDTLAGIDRVSYAGQAEPVEYSALLEREDVPEDMRSLNLIFRTYSGESDEEPDESNTEILKTVSFQYGDSFDESIYPEVSGKDGCYVKWDRTTLENLRFDTVVTATWPQYVTALASDAVRDDGRAVFYIEGDFEEGDTIAAVRQTPEPSAQQYEEEWVISCPDDGRETHAVRFRPVVSGEDVPIYLRGENGEWLEVDAQEQGSYLRFEITGNQAVIAVGSPHSQALRAERIAIAAVAAAGVVVLAAVLVRRRKKRVGMRGRSEKR